MSTSPTPSSSTSSTPAPPPVTGDAAIDAATSELAGTGATDLEATIEAGESVHRTLQARLSDLTA